MRQFVLLGSLVFAVALPLSAGRFAAPAAPSQQSGSGNSGAAKAPDQKSGDSSAFSEEVAKRLLDQLRAGLVGHSQRQALAAFDRQRMARYARFADQLQALMESYEAFRVHYRILQSADQGARAVVLVEWQMEETPRGGAAPPQRKDGQLRLVLERGAGGWKIVDLDPRELFS